MDIKLRLEEEKDYRVVEEVTREAFWNLFMQGCDEHLLVHQLRGKNEFVKELDFVAIADGKIVGNIMYTKTKILDREQLYPVLTFGPVSVLPAYQGKGIGTRLINHTAELAAKMGYRAILIYGDPEYYKRVGFNVSKEYHITNSEGKYPAALLVRELYPGSLQGIKGIFEEGDTYQVDAEEVKEFEKKFPPKQKAHTLTQEWFQEMVNKFI